MITDLKMLVMTNDVEKVAYEQGRLTLSTDGDKCAMVNFFFWGGGIQLKV